MRRLMVLRHAKSSWSDGSLGDHERPLNERGRTAATAMGRFMAESDLRPDVVLSSDSVRTRETVALWSAAADWDGPIEFLPELYLADVPTLFRTVEMLPETFHRPLLVAHNPGIAELVSAVSNALVEVPTGTLAVFEAAVDQWPDVGPSRLSTILTKRPREITG